MGNRHPAPDQEGSNLVLGRNAVAELLQGGRQTECIYICDNGKGGPVGRIIEMARVQGIPVKRVTAEKLEALSGGLPHQGVAALAAAFSYSTVEEILQRAGEEPPFLLIADGIEDPHNLGAIIRTAEAAGMHGILLPKRGSCGLTPTVGRTSAGAVEHLPIARVTNLVNAIKMLKEKGIWIYGADSAGVPWDKTDMKGPFGLVIGSEGFGLSRLVREHCDGLVSLPMMGKVKSLNASVAAGALIYEAVRQRQAIGLDGKQEESRRG